MRTAAWLTALALSALTGCRPSVPPGPFACAATADCSPNWFCAVDKHCHESARGEPLACRADSDCGGQWHCGVSGVCYDRADAGAGLSCRRALGQADSGYRGGDCGPEFRCGVEGRCHPAADAGALRCDYAADFADCTDGWRCGFSGLCLDPSGEALEPFDAGTPASPQRIRNLLGAAGEAAVSESIPAALAPADDAGFRLLQAVATLDDAGLRLIQRVAKPPLRMFPTEQEHFVRHQLRVTRVATGGVVSGPLAAERDAVTFFRDDVLTRAFTDGGQVSLRTEDGGVLVKTGATSLAVSQLQPLGPGVLGAFRPGAGGYWVIGPDPGGARWVSRPALVDLVEQEEETTACWLEVTSLGPGGEVMLASAATGDGGCTSMGLPPPLAAWDESRVRSANGLTAIAFSVPATPPSPAAEWLAFLSPGLPPGADPFGCAVACGLGGRTVNFWPFQSEAGLPAAEVLCEATPALERWWTVVEVSLLGPCLEPAIDRPTAAFYAAHQRQAPHRSRAGRYSRYQPDFETGNGQAWASPGASRNTFATAEPWFLDRPPRVVGEFPLGDGGLVLSGGERLSGVLTAEGFVASDEEISIVDGIEEPEGLLSLNRDGELMLSFTLDVVARVELVPLPVGAELHTVAVPRIEGGREREWVVSVDDQIFAATARDDGRLVTLPLAARPAPGFAIISLAARPRPTPPNRAEFFATTRVSVFRIFLDPFNRWRAEEVRVGTNAEFREVWVTPGNRARVGDRAGGVYSLPSGLLLAAPPPSGAGEAQDYASACGRDFALFAQDAYVLGPAERGVAAWRPLGLLKDRFEGGRIFKGGGLLVFGATGEAQRIACP